MVGAAQSLETTVTLVAGVAMYSWILGENCSFLVMFSVVLTLTGVFLVVQPDFIPNRYVHTLLNREDQILLIYPASMTLRKPLYNSGPHT